MIEYVYANPGLALLTSFLFGTTTGLLLAAWLIYLSGVIERYLTRRASKKREQAALKAREVKPVEIDDDKMLCALCWEERHPGQQWPLGRRTLCIDHLQGKLLEDAEDALPAAHIHEYAL